MTFWDSSALVPLLVPEEESRRCSAFLRDDPGIIVWTLTPIEVVSALYRKSREGTIDRRMLLEARGRLKAFEKVWTEVIRYDLVKERAERLLATHPLRAADSLQLASALFAFGDAPHSAAFMTLDEHLAEAAEKEGFSVPLE